MLISKSWIEDFVALPPTMSPKELGEKVTLATAEVEDVINVGEYLNVIKVAEITHIKKHPEATKLNLVTFKWAEGKDCEKEVVCGAPNVKVGMKIPYAPLGTVLPDGLKLEAKKIRGILSEGMLCSGAELGLTTDSDGLYEFPADTVIGTFLKDYFNKTPDILLDIDNKSLTHRPDLWGHYGMARELSVIYETPLKDIFNEEYVKKIESSFSKETSPIVPQVDKDSSCLGYFGISLDEVKVEESPLWMQERLNAVGLRPINNIVDISNYVMLELGIPLHIFDRDKIKDQKIVIKRVGSESNFKTLDEIDRKLLPTDTVICDAERPLVLGGIMGGLESGVTEQTSRIFIEVANWQAHEVRKVSTRLGLRTESSQRYEKSLDSQLLRRTLLRTVELVLELCPQAKIIGKDEYDGPSLSDYTPLQISMKLEEFTRKLGTEVSGDRVESILTGLGFLVSKEKGGEDHIRIQVPSFRSTKDIECSDDIVEEIGRIIGYDSITPLSPMGTLEIKYLDPAKTLQRKIQDHLILHGRCHEIMTYPLIGDQLLKKSHWPSGDDNLKLQNSLSSEQNQMRTSLIPSLIQIAAHNQKYFDSFNMFEIGRCYHSITNERYQVAIGLFSRNENPFMELMNLVENLFHYLNIKYHFTDRLPKINSHIVNENWVGLHPIEKYHIQLYGKHAGVMTSLHPLLTKSFKIKGNLVLAVIDITDFHERPIKNKMKYVPLSKYPSSKFDLTVVASAKTPVKELLDVLKKGKISKLESTKVVSVFPMDDERKAVTLSTHFADKNMTLSHDFIKESERVVVEKLGSAGFPLKEA